MEILGVAEREARVRDIGAFMRETFVYWYGERTEVHLWPFPVLPRQFDYRKIKGNPDKGRFGVYTLNPETMLLDWGAIHREKIKVFDFKEMLSRPFSEIAEHALIKHGLTHHLPGIEYAEHLARNPDKIPDSLMDGSYYFLFGSVFYDNDGVARVMCTHLRRRFCNIGDCEWCRCAGRLDRRWESNDRVIMVEK